MKRGILSICLFLALQVHSQNEFFIGNGAEVHTFSTMTFKNTSLENNGRLIVDDYIEWSGEGNTISIINNNECSASAIGFLGTNEYHTDGDFFTNDILLEDNASIYMASGSFQLGSQIIGETNDRTLTGAPGTFIHLSKDAGVSDNLGNIGIEITAADQAPGFTDIYRRYTSVSVNGAESILRYYDIETEHSDLNATARFYFYDTDLNGLVPADLTLYKSEDGGTTWSEEGGTLTQQAAYFFLEKPGIDTFSIWAIAEQGLVLPVELIFFDAEAVNNEIVVCNWETASEVNNDYFRIERSQNGSEFESVGVVEGNGTTTQLNRYEFTDTAPYNGTSYYRLKQVDFNGDYDYSELRQVFIEKETGIVLYPNPSVETVFVTVPESLGATKFTVYDQQGRIVKTGDVLQQTLSVNVSSLAAGMYVFELAKADRIIRQIKFIKQ